MTILGKQVGGSGRSGTEGQDEHLVAFTGRFPPPAVVYSPSASHRFGAGERTDAEMLFALCSV